MKISKVITQTRVRNFNEEYINIIECCDKLLADEKLEVSGFGRNGDLELHIYKDSDFEAGETANLVTITTLQDGVPVDDVEDTYVTDGSLYNELERINNYRDFELL